MIYSVKGELVHLDPRTAVISCGGVGFRCYITMNTARQLPAIGQEVMLYTILNVREDAIELFGFADQSELACFKQLTSISGVGPKAANAVLSELSPEKVALAVASGDYRAFTRASGVGPKLAQRITLEMKDKVGSFAAEGESLPQGVASVSGNAEEAVRALAVLGFNVSEASAAVGKLDSSLPVEQLVRAALKTLGGR
ncbi:MAG: Holliday junction branch migration protein RuvA [Clostridia bacterium]|nr:Holliday junction branch migration protein RuvA [Clostridia bacterium]